MGRSGWVVDRRTVSVLLRPEQLLDLLFRFGHDSHLLPAGCSRRRGGSEHPDSDFQAACVSTAARPPAGRRSAGTGSTTTTDTPACRPLRTIWHGSTHERIHKRLELQPQHPRFSSRCRSCQRPGASGSISAHHAFRFHANAVITMYAQLLSRLSTGHATPARRSAIAPAGSPGCSGRWHRTRSRPPR